MLIVPQADVPVVWLSIYVAHSAVEDMALAILASDCVLDGLSCRCCWSCCIVAVHTAEINDSCYYEDTERYWQYHVIIHSLMIRHWSGTSRC